MDDLDLELLARALQDEAWPLLQRTFVRAGDAVVRSARQRGIIGDLVIKQQPRPRAPRLRSAGFSMAFDETNPRATEWAAR